MSETGNDAKKRETLADIVAEIRAYGAQPPPRLMWLEIADRIEAAWKRERAEIEAQALSIGGIVESSRHTQKPQGNAAAMREALEKAKKAICHHAEHICQSLSWENSNLQSNCADVLCAHRELCEAKTAINAALSAPARNCDHVDYLERFKCFCRGRNCQGCKYEGDGADCYAAFLLDRAEEGGKQ